MLHTATAVQLSDLGAADDSSPRVRMAQLPLASNPNVVRLVEGKSFVIAVPDGPFAQPYHFRLESFEYKNQTFHWVITSDEVPTIYGTHAKERLLTIGDDVAWIQLESNPLCLHRSHKGLRVPYSLTLPGGWRFSPRGEFYRLLPT